MPAGSGGIISTQVGFAFVEPKNFPYMMVYDTVALKPRGDWWPFMCDTDGKLLVNAGSATNNADYTYTNFSIPGAAGTNVLAANPLRKYLMIQNTDSVGTIFIGFSNALDFDRSIRVEPGGFYEPSVAPSNIVWIISNTSSTKCLVIEGN